MAEYCKQCSLEEFGIDHNDLAGLTTPNDTADGKYEYVICEGCGFSIVDHTGTCVADCSRNHRNI